MSSPKLLAVAEEIKEILRKHDITGAVTLHDALPATQGHLDINGFGEYFMHLNSSYSCAYQYNENEVRFNTRNLDIPQEEKRFKAAATSNMLKILADSTAMVAFNLMNWSKHWDKLLESRHENP